MQFPYGALVQPRRSGAHQQSAFEDLVPVAVVWKLVKHLHGPAGVRGRHGHRLRSALEGTQECIAQPREVRAPSTQPRSNSSTRATTCSIIAAGSFPMRVAFRILQSSDLT